MPLHRRPSVSFLLVAILLALQLLGTTASFRLQILHTNDMHAHFEEISQSGGPCGRSGTEACYGGFARLAAEVARLKAESPQDTIFLNAGDTFQGTPYYYIFKWSIVKEFIDKLGIDVMSLGNHEFDDGVDGLEPFLRAVKTPNVAANLDLSWVPSLNSSQVNLRPSVNLFIKGVNISIIGYVTPDTKYLARPGLVRFKDEVPVLKELAKEAKAAGAKLVIAVGHSGFTMDKKIAQEVEDVDIVIGGHTNTFLYTGSPPDIEVPESTYPHMVQQASGKMVPVVQAYCHTKYLGRLEVKFDDNFKLLSATGNPILLDSTLPQDPAIVEELQHWKANMSSQLDEVVGRMVVDLDGRTCRNTECNMGNFFADALVDYHVRETEGRLYEIGWTNVPIALLNGGSIRTSLNLNDTRGELTVGDILTVVPFDNKMVILNVTGGMLKEVLEQGVRGYDLTQGRGKGGFLQVSGLRVTYDLSRPEGQRVTEVEARCSACLVPEFNPLEPTANYTIILSEYLAQGGDGFEIFASVPLEHQEKLEWRDLEGFRSYASKSTPLYPGVEGRLKFGATSLEHSSGGASGPQGGGVSGLQGAGVSRPQGLGVLLIAFITALSTSWSGHLNSH